LAISGRLKFLKVPSELNSAGELGDQLLVCYRFTVADSVREVIDPIRLHIDISAHSIWASARARQTVSERIFDVSEVLIQGLRSLES
jgi:hypothetical protein